MYEIPIYEAKISGIDDSGIFAMSFVEYPAIGQNFIALKEQAQKARIKLDKAKQVLTGAVLIPDQLIYRYTPERGEYFLKFTAKDIEKTVNKLMREGIALQNTTHEHADTLKDNYLLELWIVTDPKKDKANALGLGELPVGTLMASYKIGDAAYWRDEVLTGHVHGFSLEGIFNLKYIDNMSKKTKKAADLEKARKAAQKNRVPAFFKAVATFLEGTDTEAKEVADEAAKDETDSGTPYLIFTLKDGGEVRVDNDGFCTLNDEQMPAGEHELDDGNFIVVDDNGIFQITETETGEDTQPTEAELAAAKERGKKVIEGLKKSKSTNLSATNKKIAALERELAELKKDPSTRAVKATIDKPDLASMSFTDKVAMGIAQRRARMYGKTR